MALETWILPKGSCFICVFLNFSRPAQLPDGPGPAERRRGEREVSAVRGGHGDHRERVRQFKALNLF